MRTFILSILLSIVFIQNTPAQKDSILSDSIPKWKNLLTPNKAFIHYLKTLTKDSIIASNYKEHIRDSVISFDAVLISADLLAINYDGLEGVNPKLFEYYVAIWQGSQILELSRAKRIQKITNIRQDGSFNFKDVGINSYEFTVGLGVNLSDSTSIVATIDIPENAKQGSTYHSQNTTIKVTYHSTNSLAAQFKTPKFNSPKKNQNWIALFKGPFTSNFFYGINVVYTTFVTQTTNTGYVSMNNIPGGLEENQTYTLVYGTSITGDNKINFKSIVASTEFKVPKRQ